MPFPMVTVDVHYHLILKSWKRKSGCGNSKFSFPVSKFVLWFPARDMDMVAQVAPGHPSVCRSCVCCGSAVAQSLFEHIFSGV